LGLSTTTVYRRLDAFNGKLDKYLTRGINNETLFNSDAQVYCDAWRIWGKLRGPGYGKQ